MEKEQYIHIVGWCRNGSELLFLRLNRAFNKLDLMAADPLTGSSRIVLTDTQKTFIMGEQFSYKWPQICTLLEDGQRFLWMSEKNGWNHLYLYHINGNLLNRLNKGSYRVDQVITIDEAKGCVYFLAHPDQKRPYDTHLCKVNLNGEGFKQLTDATGYHWTQFAPSKEYFLDYHSNVDRPRKIDLRRADGTLLRTLAETDIMGLKELNWLPPEEFTVKAADGVTDLHGIIFKPFDFDPDKKYPIIENIYAGPQEAVVPHHFLGSSWWSDRNAVGAQALAQLGFIVYIVDGRGTVGRSKKFHDVVYGNFGTHEIPEHVGVLRQLGQNYPYMDLERVGLFGFSWGGYFTLRGMLLAPDVYHVGVAVSGLAEPVGNLVEPYLGLLPDNREEYKESSCLPLAGNLKGKLLLMVGTSDPLYSQNMKMVEALIQAGVPYDLNLFPGQGHDFVDHSRTYRNYLWITLGRYFQEHL
ncbi:MAG: S9 family peptidase, partial [Cyclobacteriaceae bacterium]|nr:S9 family peptidase [Cyclobacteriaceae bacterium]